jgi:hypothetical protein
MATYVNDLRLKEIATGDEAGTWGTSTNTNLELIGEALGYGTQDCFASDADATTTVADGATDPARAMYFKVTSSATLTATRTLTIAPNTISRVMLIENATTGSQSITISQGSGSTVTIASGAVKMVYLDGAGAGGAVVEALADLELPTVTVADLTATTADINGGTIDGTVIGGSSAAAVTGTTITGTSFVSSGDMTFGDSDKAIFGAGSDLQIYHDGSDSYITHTTGGNFFINDDGAGYLMMKGSDLYFRNPSNVDMIHAQSGGFVKLYYNGVAKLATTATGIDVTGTVTADGLTVDDTSGTVGLFNSTGVASTLAINNTHANAWGSNIAFRTGGTDAGYFGSIGSLLGNTDQDLVSYSTAGNGFRIYTNGNNERLRIDSSGNVGIGTASPSTQLQIAGPTFAIMRLSAAAGDNNARVDFGTLASPDVGRVGYNNSTNALTFRTNGVDAVTIDSSQNVGIGTSSPSNTLDLRKDTPAFSQTSSSGAYYTTLGTNVDYTKSFVLNNKGSEIITYGDDTGYGLNLNGGASNLIRFTTNATERMRITSSGKVGIGNSLPLGRLTISNAAGTNAPSTVTAANTYLQLGSDDYGPSNNGKFMIGFGFTDATNTNSPAYIGYEEATTSGDTYGDLTFYTRSVTTDTAPTERMRIDSSGNVGIGTSSPATKLEVTGDISGTWASGANRFVGSQYLTGSDYQLGMKTTMDTRETQIFAKAADTGGYVTIATGTTPSERLRVDGSGNVGINATTIAANGLQIGNTSSTDTEQLYLYTNKAIFSISTDGATNGAGTTINYSFANGGGGPLKFTTASGEVARLDASGNLLVGKTSADNTTAGTRINSDGSASFVKNGNLLYLNRNTTDGDIVTFAKDNTAVGSIGAAGGDITIGTGDTGLTFEDSADVIHPINQSTGAARDNAIDLGKSAARFKDLYLSGASLAGAGSAAFPSISFSGDINTGLYSSAADNIGFATGGTARAFMSASQFNMTGNGVFSGSISKGSGSFKIDHPLPEKAETHHLVHSFVESPQADNIYRGKVDLVDGAATVNIDDAAGMTEGTYVLLNTNTQCFTSNESGWTAVKGSVSGNILTITAQESCSDTISWMVIGERHDQHMLDTEWTDENGKVIVEPLKELEGDAP